MMAFAVLLGMVNIAARLDVQLSGPGQIAKQGQDALQSHAAPSVTAGPRWHSLASSNGKWKLRGLTPSETSQPRAFAAILSGDQAKLARPFLSLHSLRVKLQV